MSNRKNFYKTLHSGASFNNCTFNMHFHGDALCSYGDAGNDTDEDVGVCTQGVCNPLPASFLRTDTQLGSVEEAPKPARMSVEASFDVSDIVQQALPAVLQNMFEGGNSKKWDSEAFNKSFKDLIGTALDSVVSSMTEDGQARYTNETVDRVKQWLGLASGESVDDNATGTVINLVKQLFGRGTGVNDTDSNDDTDGGDCSVDQGSVESGVYEEGGDDTDVSHGDSFEDDDVRYSLRKDGTSPQSDRSDCSDGDRSDCSDGDRSDCSDGDRSDCSDGDRSDRSDGDRSDRSDGDRSDDVSDGDSDREEQKDLSAKRALIKNFATRLVRDTLNTTKEALTGSGVQSLVQTIGDRLTQDQGVSLNTTNLSAILRNTLNKAEDESKQ